MLKKVQGHARVHLAKRRSGRKAREKRSVIAVQCAYRAHTARLAAAYKRVIRSGAGTQKQMHTSDVRIKPPCLMIYITVGIFVCIR